MRAFIEGLLTVLCILGMGYAICLLANYDELVRPYPPCPVDEVTEIVDSLYDDGLISSWKYADLRRELDKAQGVDSWYMISQDTLVCTLKIVNELPDTTTEEP